MTPSATSRAGRVATARKPPRNVPADSWSRSGIGERDPHDGQAQRGGTREDRPVRARQAGIDQREPVVLGDQVFVDDAQPGDDS